jgi:hypothetical protein
LRPRSAPDKPAAITNVLRPPSIGSVRQRPAGCIKARRCLRKKLPRPGVIRPGRVHKHGRRRRPGGGYDSIPSARSLAPPAGVWRRATPRLRGGRTDEVVAPGPYRVRPQEEWNPSSAGAGTRARAAHRGFTWTTPTWQPIDGRDARDAKSGRAPFSFR